MSGDRGLDLAVPITTADHSIGAAQPRLTIVEYGDFECPNCKQAAPAVKMLLAEHPGHIRFVFRHFPLVEVHTHAMHAALAAEAAAAQGRFWQMRDLIFENQRDLKVNQRVNTRSG